MADPNIVVFAPSENCIKIKKWRVREGYQVSHNQVILLYEVPGSDNTEIKRLKSTKSGVVKRRIYEDGALVDKGVALLELSECIHTTVIKDMCADCGADLRQENEGNQSEASVPMVHAVPDLKVSQTLAEEIGKADTARLLQDKKLVLLVDLDQTLIHTTNDNVPDNLRAVYHFQLYGPNSPWYHTRLRPGTSQFLTNIAPFFELHICTFGARNYAHTIAQFLDEDGKFFSHRILSRDECFSANSKQDNLKALFPCGDSMVCIIDDREDVWNMATNLIQVKPYHFFQHTGDINAPPGMTKNELDGKGVDFNDLLKEAEKKEEASRKSKSDENNAEIAAAEESKSTDVTGKLENNSTETTQEPQETPAPTDNKETADKEESEEIDASADNKKEQSADDKTEQTVDKEEDKSSEETNRDSDDNLIDIEDPDDYLLYLEQVLKKIHLRFYEIHDSTKTLPDLKQLIPKIRSEVLVGKHLVFSGLVPNHMKLEQSKAYLIAKSLGSTVSKELDEKTTHLVAVTSGTFKVNTSRKRPDIHIVTPDWLWSCAERWECVDERVFPLDPNKPSKMRQPPPHCHSPEHVANYLATPPVDGKDLPAKFIDTINPLLSFTNDDIDEMNKDFDQFFESDDDSSSDDEPVDIENPPIDKKLRKRKRQEEKEEQNIKQVVQLKLENTPDEESMQEDNQFNKDNNSFSSDDDESPSIKFRRGEDLPSDLDMGSAQSEGSEDPIDEDDGDWNMMGAALEREFLGME